MLLPGQFNVFQKPFGSGQIQAKMDTNWVMHKSYRRSHQIVIVKTQTNNGVPKQYSAIMKNKKTQNADE